MKYGIVENNKFVLIDNDLQRLKNTLLFIPSIQSEQIHEYVDDDIEKGYDGSYYLKGHAPQKPFEKAKSDKLKEIHSAYDAIITSLTGKYPESEKLTFSQQLSEAQSYIADNNSSVPLLTALSEARNVKMATLAKRIIKKAEAYTQQVGNVIGQRQAFEDELEKCKTTEEVEKIKVNFEIE